MSKSSLARMLSVSPTTTSQLTCPECGHASIETMPLDACMYFYDCKGCGTVLRPNAGDCCVFCSYGDVPCPPEQTGQSCCSSATPQQT